jgi:tripartite-type tricarboxylate transporter receptor subunit TctC
MLARSMWRFVAVALALSGGIAAGYAAEMTYPTKPIRVIVPYPPGGSTDPTARAFGTWLSDKFGVPDAKGTGRNHPQRAGALDQGDTRRRDPGELIGL